MNTRIITLKQKVKQRNCAFYCPSTFHNRSSDIDDSSDIDGSSDIVYSYLMCSQAIDQNIFPKVLGTAQVFYCPKPTAEGNRTLELFPVPREKNLVYLLPGYTLDNCFIT